MPIPGAAPIARRVRIACVVYVLLHVAAHLSARWFEVADGVSLWYAPTGLALTLLVLVGPRCAPVVFLANMAGALITPGVAHWWDPWLFPALITLNLTGVAVVVRRFHGPTLLPGTTRETTVFATVTIVAPALVALPGTGVAVLLGITAPEAFAENALRWWVGDASGLLTVVPVAMVFASPWLGTPNSHALSPRWRPRTTASFLAKTSFLIGCLWAAFALDPLAHYDAFYLCFLPLVWISLRHGLEGASIATLAITMGSLIGLHLTDAPTGRIVSFLFFEITVAVVGVGLGATVARRDAAERRLIAGEARLDRVLTGAQLGLWDWNIATGAVTYNERCAELLGHALARLDRVEPSWQEFAHPADRLRIAAALAAHLDGRSPIYETDFRVRTRDGSWRWIHSRGSIVTRDTHGHATVVSGTHLDITDRRRAEAEARRLLQIIEVTTDFVLTTDLAGRITHANAAMLRLIGVADAPAVHGRAIRDILPAPTCDTLEREAMPAARASRSWVGETQLNDAHGTSMPVSLVVLLHDSGTEEGESLSFVMRDISRLKAAEADRIENERKMQQVQKTESLGVLAGGVAHDFNNLLTIILGNANLARLDHTGDATHQELLTQVEAAATRASELCQQMLAYAGRSPLVLSDFNLSTLIHETRELLLVSIGRKIDVQFDLANPLPSVRAAGAQMQQVIMNLALNAAHAIGDRTGRIAIRTSARQMSAADLVVRTLTRPITPGEFVVFEIEDDGCGMTPETRARIFEPFFTTKFIGHGLGLASVLGIVSSHQGAIEVNSVVNQGTTFRIFLPARLTPVAAAASPLAPEKRTRGSGLALVVDDEPSVRRVARHLLESIGFETIDAVNGEDGVEKFRTHADRLRLVLLDLTMPRMGGEEAYAEMRGIRSAVPIIIMSGYSAQLIFDRFNDSPPDGFLAKPFDRPTLQATLKDAMETGLSSTRACRQTTV